MKYIDRDFFKFVFGFMAIITLSMIIIMATRIYEESSQQTASVVESERTK